MATQGNVDGSVQIFAVIEGPTSPTEYPFSFDLPPASVVVPRPDGGVDVRTQGDLDLLSIAPPWAVDASGRALPTRFVVAGTTITQIVDHEGAAYPVIADPRLSFGTYNSIYTGLTDRCRASRWTCRTVDISVVSVQSGWRNLSCGTLGGSVWNVGLGVESCTWERQVTLRVRLFGSRSGSTATVLLRDSNWGPSFLIEKTHGGCAVVCWGAPEPRESLANVGWSFTATWW